MELLKETTINQLQVKISNYKNLASYEVETIEAEVDTAFGKFGRGNLKFSYLLIPDHYTFLQNFDPKVANLLDSGKAIQLYAELKEVLRIYFEKTLKKEDTKAEEAELDRISKETNELEIQKVLAEAEILRITKEARPLFDKLQIQQEGFLAEGNLIANKISDKKDSIKRRLLFISFIIYTGAYLISQIIEKPLERQGLGLLSFAILFLISYFLIDRYQTVLHKNAKALNIISRINFLHISLKDAERRITKSCQELGIKQKGIEHEFDFLLNKLNEVKSILVTQNK